MKKMNLNIVILSILLAACNGGGTDTTSTVAPPALSFSTNDMQMLTGGKVRTLELQASNKIISDITVNLQTSNSGIHLDSNTCTLSHVNNKCAVTIISGENEGKYSITATTSDGEKSQPLNVTVYKMGTIEATSNSLTLKPNSTNTVDISLHDIDSNYPNHKLVFTAPQELELDKSECIISGSQPHCKLAITSLNQEGNYTISYHTVNTVTSKGISGYSVTPIKVKVSNSDKPIPTPSPSPAPVPTPVPDFKPQVEFTNSSINVVNGEITEAALKLVNYASADANKSYNVNFLAPNNVRIINQPNCKLNKEHSSCIVQFEAKQSGNTQLKAFSDGLTITPANVHVHTPGVVKFNRSTYEYLSGVTNTITLMLEPASPYDRVIVHLDSDHLLPLSNNTCILSYENRECTTEVSQGTPGKTIPLIAIGSNKEYIMPTSMVHFPPQN